MRQHNDGGFHVLTQRSVRYHIVAMAPGSRKEPWRKRLRLIHLIPRRGKAPSRPKTPDGSQSDPATPQRNYWLQVSSTSTNLTLADIQTQHPTMRLPLSAIPSRASPSAETIPSGARPRRDGPNPAAHTDEGSQPRQKRPFKQRRAKS